MTVAEAPVAINAPARLLVIEDDAGIRRGLELALREDGYEVRAEADGSAVAEVVEQFRPDLAILDVHLPVGPDGLALARTLRQATDLPLLFVTAAGDPDDRLAGFEAGADDYVVKPFLVAEVLARVRALLRRSGRLRSSAWQVGDVVVDAEARTATRAGVPMELTRTEFELLRVLGEHAGKIFSKVQLLTRVWGFEGYDAHLVEVHISALRRKLEAGGPRVLHTVPGAGYVLRP